ncbi:hypothetical protein PR08_gp19 [Idiomarinaceae phage Phi1M2-2]|uniref:hypothetical protein n=1 Tax=Idiomarinaceae phage Phi1M2-2 TaxID=1527515 RepID=UPI0004F802E6|nr:hypothetical protein PR08_gp19 [Idiomarinaceae phage Phi1M2-2]AIM40776.1 hypothetical protein M22_019 [Idiomarinaceae phage Phi1M2-2]
MSCPYFHEADSVKRPANALNIEVSQPKHRCAAKPKPRHEGRVLAWILSGGSAMDCCYPCEPGSEEDISQCKPSKWDRSVPK